MIHVKTNKILEEICINYMHCCIKIINYYKIDQLKL